MLFFLCICSRIKCLIRVFNSFAVEPQLGKVTPNTETIWRKHVIIMDKTIFTHSQHLEYICGVYSETEETNLSILNDSFFTFVLSIKIGDFSSLEIVYRITAEWSAFHCINISKEAI